MPLAPPQTLAQPYTALHDLRPTHQTRLKIGNQGLQQLNFLPDKTTPIHLGQSSEQKLCLGPEHLWNKTAASPDGVPIIKVVHSMQPRMQICPFRPHHYKRPACRRGSSLTSFTVISGHEGSARVNPGQLWVQKGGGISGHWQMQSHWT